MEVLMNMKATGIVRRIDDLGRIVIPKEIRILCYVIQTIPFRCYKMPTIPFPCYMMPIYPFPCYMMPIYPFPCYKMPTWMILEKYRMRTGIKRYKKSCGKMKRFRYKLPPFTDTSSTFI